jgi:Tfp pilus assembly protein PilX
MYMTTKPQDRSVKSQGFALLIALIVVGVVLSIGLSILNLSISQVRLSTDAKESEAAFHAANAGMECARYWRREESDKMERGNNSFSPECFNVTTSVDRNSPAAPTLDDASDGDATLFSYQFTWTTNDRCTSIQTFVASSTVTGNGATTTNMLTLIPGYPEGDDFYCGPGSICTVIAVQGYNQPCNRVNNTYGTIQREVLLQF